MSLHSEEQVPIRIHLTGPSFAYSGNLLKVDLLSFSRTIIDVQSMLDRSFAVLNKSRRVTKKNRQEFKLIANKIKPGSLEIDAILSLAPIMVPLITEYAPTAYKVIKTAIEAFELGKLLREFILGGHSAQPTYNNVGTVNNINIETVTINNPFTQEDIQTDMTTYLAAILSSRSHERLLQHMNQDSVAGISLSVDKSNLSMSASVNDKPLFKPQIRLDDTIQKYRVKIHALDVETKSGELRIYENNRLSDPVRFTIIGAQDLKHYSLALNMDILTISALPEYQSDLSGRRLIRLHIANILIPAA